MKEDLYYTNKIIENNEIAPETLRGHEENLNIRNTNVYMGE